MAALSQALELARSWMGERQSPPEVFSDSFLIPIAKEVYRDIQRLLEKAGFPLLSDYAVFSVAANDTEITDGDTGFPLDVIKPIRLWEKANAAAFSTYIAMEEADPDLIPRAATTELTHWEWKGKSLLFIGSASIRDIRMKYDKFLGDLVDENSPLEIKDSVGPMSFGIAAGAGLSRGSEFYKEALALYTASVADLIARETGRLTAA